MLKSSIALLLCLAANAIASGSHALFPMELAHYKRGSTTPDPEPPVLGFLANGFRLAAVNNSTKPPAREGVRFPIDRVETSTKTAVRLRPVRVRPGTRSPVRTTERPPVRVRPVTRVGVDFRTRRFPHGGPSDFGILTRSTTTRRPSITIPPWLRWRPRPTIGTATYRTIRPDLVERFRTIPPRWLNPTRWARTIPPRFTIPPRYRFDPGNIDPVPIGKK